MQDQKQLVMSWTAGGWSGSIRGLDNLVEQIPECRQIREGDYNAGSHYGFRLKPPVLKHRRWIWPYVRKGQRCQTSQTSHDGDVELSVAHSFWNAIRVYYLGLLRLIGHR
jgi:hypothetical protein